MESKTPPEDTQICEIFDEEFGLGEELKRLRRASLLALADAVELFVAALTSIPIRWAEAELFAIEVAAEGYGVDPDLEHLRNTVIRALTPMLANLPRTMPEMSVAIEEPTSEPSCALAAARIIRIFGNEFRFH
jgi:hypothetical protein